MLTTLLLLLASSAYGGSICNDGWVSPSEGSGTCSYHGGIARPSGISVPSGPSLSSGWVFSSGVTSSGTVYFGFTRNDPTIQVALSCFAFDPVGWRFAIYLFSSSGGALAGTTDNRYDAADGTTPLDVFVRKGDAVDRIVSWDVSVKDYGGGGGPLALEKKMNVEHFGQAGGVLFLTDADLVKIERADSLHVSVYIGEIVTDNLNTYQLDMSELRGKLPALRQRCTAASVQAATNNKEKK
jgi:hypothetical protein